MVVNDDMGDHKRIAGVTGVLARRINKMSIDLEAVDNTL